MAKILDDNEYFNHYVLQSLSPPSVLTPKNDVSFSTHPCSLMGKTHLVLLLSGIFCHELATVSTLVLK